MNVFQFILDYFLFRLSSFVAGQRHYPEWKVKNYTMRTATLKNKALAKDLETACKKNGGILTYAEYLAIEQFGPHGYHATHKDFGRTGTHEHWPKAILAICKKNGFKEVVEFGSGDATLGIEIAKIAQKGNFPLLWHGVEINKELQKQTIEGFKNHHLEKFFGKVVSKFADLNINKPCLVIFSYSLDSIPPEIFINTKQQRGFPDTIIGITVKNGVLTEQALTKSELHKKGFTIQDGIVAKSGNNYDLRGWQLYPWQRAYISLESFAVFQDAVKHFKKDSVFLILDEFRPAPFAWEVGHRCTPKSLYKAEHEQKNVNTYYKHAGENLFYYPQYLNTFNSYLNSVGFSSINFDIEQKMARVLCGDLWIPFKKTYFTYAFLATKTQNVSPKIITVKYPARTIL